MSNFNSRYQKFLQTLQSLSLKESTFKQIRQPKLSDIELIAINLTAESLGIDSERQLFRMLPNDLTDKIERSNYNKRKRRLYEQIEQVHKHLAHMLTTGDAMFIVDSMPLEVCRLSRAKRSTICKDNFDSAPDFGYCASQNLHYYGYKLHAVCTDSGIFTCFDISKASIHDIHYLKDLKYNLANCTLLGDKGYLSASQQLDLFSSCNIRLEVPYRLNQKNWKPFPATLRAKRKRIETLFSQMCDQFMIRRNYAKSISGFCTRIVSKLTALTLIQFINCLLGRKINSIKSFPF